MEGSMFKEHYLSQINFSKTFKLFIPLLSFAVTCSAAQDSIKVTTDRVRDMLYEYDVPTDVRERIKHRLELIDQQENYLNDRLRNKDIKQKKRVAIKFQKKSIQTALKKWGRWIDSIGNIF